MPEFNPDTVKVAAQRMIGKYIQQVGAYGDPDKIRKALDMLISSAALGYGFVSSNQIAVIDMLLRTSKHVAQRMEDGDAYPDSVQ